MSNERSCRFCQFSDPKRTTTGGAIRCKMIHGWVSPHGTCKEYYDRAMRELIMKIKEANAND